MPVQGQLPLSTFFAGSNRISLPDKRHQMEYAGTKPEQSRSRQNGKTCKHHQIARLKERIVISSLLHFPSTMLVPATVSHEIWEEVEILQAAHELQTLSPLNLCYTCIHACRHTYIHCITSRDITSHLVTSHTCARVYILYII